MSSSGTRARCRPCPSSGDAVTATHIGHRRVSTFVQRALLAESDADADAWWRSLSDAEKRAHQRAGEEIAAEFAAASEQGLDVRSPQVQAIAARQYDWVRTAWGGTAPSAEAFAGLGRMYVEDPRLGKAFSAEGRSVAAYVRDAMVVYAEDELGFSSSLR